MSEDKRKNHFQKISPFGADITNDSMVSSGNGDIDFLMDFQTALGAPSLSSFYKVSLDLSAGTGFGESRNAAFGDVSEASLENWLRSCGVTVGPNAIRRFELLASEAILPGSSMSVVSEVGSRQGITEKFATQRTYNDIAITYYIPADYTSLRLFQEWINFMNPLYFSDGEGQEILQSGASEGYAGAGDFNSFHRFRYPNEYKKTMSITKFEKNVGNANLKSRLATDMEGNAVDFIPEAISYKFINAFPTAIQDVALTYESSTVLQVTVEFSYDRDIIISNKTETGVASQTIPQRSNRETVLVGGKKIKQQNSGTENLGNYEALNDLSNIG